MLALAAQLPTRTRLQEMILELCRALDGLVGPPAKDLRKMLKHALLLEVWLGDRAREAALKHLPLDDRQKAVLANPGQWTYEPQIEIACTKVDDGPGVQFSFAREIVLTQVGKRLATGRYYVGRNGLRHRFDDRLEALTAADDFLAGPGAALGPLTQQEFRRRLQECVAEVQLV